MKTIDRYEVTYGDSYFRYKEKECSICSAERIANFYGTIARVVDLANGEMVAAVIPNEKWYRMSNSQILNPLTSL